MNLFRRAGTGNLRTHRGLQGEALMDSDKNTLVVMDGVTPGGNPLASVRALNVFSATQVVTPRLVNSQSGVPLQIDAALSNNHRINVTGSLHVAAPIRLTDGQILNLLFVHAAAGSQVFTITFDSMFDFGVQPAPLMAAGPSHHLASCYYDEMSNKLICTWRQGSAGAGV